MFISVSIGGNYQSLIDAPTLIFLFGMCFSIMLLQYGSDVFRSWRLVFKKALTEDEKLLSVDIWKRAGSVFIGIGILQDVISQIVMGAIADHAVDNVDMLRGYELALLGTFWGIVFSYGLCSPVAHYLDSKAVR